MKAIFTAAALLLLTLSADIAGAQCRRPANRNPHASNSQLIRRNAANGRLTRAETMRLKQRRRGIGQDIRLARADGRVSAPERRIIHREQRNLRYDIRRESNDRQVRR